MLIKKKSLIVVIVSSTVIAIVMVLALFSIFCYAKIRIQAKNQPYYSK